MRRDGLASGAARTLKNGLKSLEARFFPGRVFTRIYEKGRWLSGGTASGAGSTLESTGELRRLLPAVLERHDVRSILDIPCGDLNWMSRLDYRFERYVGADIVASIVEANRLAHAGEGRRFEHLDVITDALPAVDLVFCRDCWVHLSNPQIARAIANLRRSGSRLLLATTYPGRGTNPDIRTGDWRAIDLEAAPFSLPPALEILRESGANAAGPWADKSLGLWRIADLP